MWVPCRFGIVYTHEQQLCRLACASDSMCWKGQLLLRWQAIPHSLHLLHPSHLIVPRSPKTPTQTTHTTKLKKNGPNHTFHKTWLLQLWAMKAQWRIRLGKVHAVITRYEICRKCLKNKRLFGGAETNLMLLLCLNLESFADFPEVLRTGKVHRHRTKTRPIYLILITKTHLL